MSSPRRPRLLPTVLLLLLVLAPASSAAQEATPTAFEELPTTTLLDVPLESLPEPPALVGLARLVFPSGSTLLGGPVNGPRLFLVETGSFSIRLDSEATLWRNNDSSTTETVSRWCDHRARRQRPPDRAQPTTVRDHQSRIRPIGHARHHHLARDRGNDPALHHRIRRHLRTTPRCRDLSVT